MHTPEERERMKALARLARQRLRDVMGERLAEQNRRYAELLLKTWKMRSRGGVGRPPVVLPHIVAPPTPYKSPLL